MGTYEQGNKVYLKICADIEARARALYPLADIAETIHLAEQNHPKKYRQVKSLETGFEEIWADEKAALEEVKNAMLAWARKCLELYKMRHEELSTAQQSLAMGQ